MFLFFFCNGITHTKRRTSAQDQMYALWWAMQFQLLIIGRWWNPPLHCGAICHATQFSKYCDQKVARNRPKWIYSLKGQALFGYYSEDPRTSWKNLNSVQRHILFDVLSRAFNAAHTFWVNIQSLGMTSPESSIETAMKRLWNKSFFVQ